MIITEVLKLVKQFSMEEKALQFGLYSIKEKASYLNSLDSLNVKEFDIGKVGLSKGYRLDFDADNGILTVEPTIDFVYRGTTDEVVKLFGVVVEMQFHLQDFEGIVNKIDDNTIDAPDPLIINLISIAYSTARGVLHCHTSKSDYEGLYLPLTDPGEFKEAIHEEED